MGTSLREEQSICEESLGIKRSNSSSGMNMHDFEALEKLVDKERRRMREECEQRRYYDLQMAYLEEGIMMN